MRNSNYSDFTSNLSKSLNIHKPLKISDKGDFSLIIGGNNPLWVEFSYLTDKENVRVSCCLTHQLPKQLRDLHSLMNKLIKDLLKKHKKIGKLVADPESQALYFVSEISLLDLEPSEVGGIVQNILDEARDWKKKIARCLEHPKRSAQEKELLDFSLPSFLK